MMSKWKFIYCLTKRLSESEENFETFLYCLNKSIELAARFHTIKIITDSQTIEYLNHLNVEIELFDFGHLRFLDDIKISVLPHLKENEILVDPDVFLYKELKIDENCDLFCERPEHIIKDEWYRKDYELSRKFKFSSLIKFESKKYDICNIGILKFFNKELLKQYIEKYNFVKSVALEESDELYEFPTFSILLGQLLLKNIIDENDYKLKYARLNPYNEYYHLAGEQKYDKDYLKRSLEKKNQNTLI
jgi:hypothetical protein